MRQEVVTSTQSFTTYEEVTRNRSLVSSLNKNFNIQFAKFIYQVSVHI